MAGMIGKTRQETKTTVVTEVFDTAAGQARGVLKGPVAAGRFKHSRHSPTVELAGIIAHYWMVSWDLLGEEPQIRETLPHPNVHAVFEQGNSVVAGVATGKFTRVLEGRSHVFGVKFRPGGFRGFVDGPVSSLTNRMVTVRNIFGDEVVNLEQVLVSSSEESDLVAAANAFFCARVPDLDETSVLAGQLVDRIFTEPEIRTVDDLTKLARIGKRSLQRIFREYVGVSPKWVIRRYRLHELVERLHAGERMDGAALATELGYLRPGAFDQRFSVDDWIFARRISRVECFKSVAGYVGVDSP